MSTSLAVALSFVVLASIGTGVAVFLIAGKALPLLPKLCFSAVGLFVSALLSFDLADSCYNSYQLHIKALDLLNAVELKTLKQTQLICPAVYTFVRDGEKTCLTNFGDRVRVGCG